MIRNSLRGSKNSPQLVARIGAVALSLAVVFALAIVAIPAQAQTFQIIHNFAGPDGATPTGALTIDQAGNLYGTTQNGGVAYFGNVFKLKHESGGWVFQSLYAFTGGIPTGNDGGSPAAGVIFGPDGALYGTTSQGGINGGGAGTVFKLQPPSTDCKTAPCPWTETVLHRFSRGGQFLEGALPGAGDLIFDQMGNLYGTTISGGNMASCPLEGCGTVYELTPSGSGWTERILHAFSARPPEDGWNPMSGVVFDRSGNLYGTTFGGGKGSWPFEQRYGTVYELTPSGSGWAETILHSFQFNNDADFPVGGLTFDPLGNLYGTGSLALNGGFCCGALFELTPSNGNWTYADLYFFPFNGYSAGKGPDSNLVMDSAGNLYGTALSNGCCGPPVFGWGSVFKLTFSNGRWTETDLYDFTGGSDGYFPYGGVVLDANGNLYGTTSTGGAYGGGVVWEITP